MKVLERRIINAGTYTHDIFLQRTKNGFEVIDDFDVGFDVKEYKKKSSAYNRLAVLTAIYRKEQANYLRGR